MRKLFLAIIFSKLAISFLYSQHVLYSDFYTGFHTYSVQDRKGNHIINTDDFIGTNIKVDTINNVYLATKSDEIIIYNLDGNQPKNITAIYTFDHSNYVISPLEKSIYYISENQIFRLSYEGKRDTITKQITNVKLSDLCIDPIKKKLYFNKYLNSSGTLIQSDLNGSNQKIIYFYSNINLDLYGMQLDSKHNRMFYRYWENISKIGVLNLDNKSFEEVLRQEYGSLLEYYYDEINEDLYFVNTRKKNIEKKNLKTDIVSIVKRTYPAEVQYISKFKNQIIWMESWNNNYGEFYIGDINDVDHKELFYNNKTVPIRFDYNPKTKKIIGRTNWNQVVSSDITGENFKLQTDRGISSYTDILFYKDRLFYIDGSKYFIVSSKKDGSDYKVLKHFTGLNVVSAVIDDRTEYIYYVNKYNYSIDRIKINGSGFETFWLSTDRDPILSDIALDKENNQLIVTEKDCKCIFTLSLETKVRKIIKSGTITTFYPEEFVYNSRNKFLYINDFWNKKIYRMKIDGSNFTTLKTNTSGAYIKHYDAVENKMYGILSDNATIVEFDENANKINSLATNFGKKISVKFTKEPGKDIFYFIDLDDWQTQKVYSLDLTNSKFNNVLNSYSNPFADFNDYTIDNATNTYYEYADVSGLLIETKIDLDTTFYYNDWPTYLHGIDIIESTNEFVAYSDNAILKYSKEGKLLDTLVKAEPASNTIKNFYSATYNKIDNRIYFFDYYTKQIRSVTETGENIQTHFTFTKFINTGDKIKFDREGRMYLIQYKIDQNFLIQLNVNQTIDTIYLPGLKLNGNIIILDSLPLIDADGDGLTFDKDCNDNQVISAEIANNGIDEDCDGIDLIIDMDGDGFNSNIDCNDQNAIVNPYALEIPYNGIDEDCNNLTPDDDLDGDGFILTLDCNDTIATINPSVLEIPNNNIDDNCDGEIDEISSTSEEKKSRVLLFPNPTNDIVHLISDEEIFKIQIISLAGIIIFDTNNSTIDVSRLNPGLYILDVQLISRAIIKLKLVVI